MNLNLKYRPQVFEDVIGQSVTTTILKKVIEQRNFKNVYLFAGKTGSGKTTCARIFAKAINNGIGDPIEMDAATIGRGSGDTISGAIADLMDDAKSRALIGEYKIYIIDECHALSSAAWQAFLRGIEEPPKYTIFIFCTTEPWKIPATVLNRMQRYSFSTIPMTEIKNRLMYICEQEHYSNYEKACDFISKVCNGSARDAITTLEQCADYSTDLDIQNVKHVLGEFSYETMFKLTWSLLSNDEGTVLTAVDNLESSGIDLKNFINNYLEFILDLAKFKIFNNIDITNIPAYLATEQNRVVQDTVDRFVSVNVLNQIADLLLDLKSLLRFDTSYKSTIIVYLLRIMRLISK